MSRLKGCPHIRGWNKGVLPYMRYPHFRVRGSPVYRGVLIWNRGVPLYTEVSSCPGEEIEEFNHIQRCPHAQEMEIEEYTEVHSCPGDGNRGVPPYTEEFHHTQRCPDVKEMEIKKFIQ